MQELENVPTLILFPWISYKSEKLTKKIFAFKKRSVEVNINQISAVFSFKLKG